MAWRSPDLPTLLEHSILVWGTRSRNQHGSISASGSARVQTPLRRRCFSSYPTNFRYDCRAWMSRGVRSPRQGLGAVIQTTQSREDRRGTAYRAEPPVVTPPDSGDVGGLSFNSSQSNTLGAPVCWL